MKKASGKHFSGFDKLAYVRSARNLPTTMLAIIQNPGVFGQNGFPESVLFKPKLFTWRPERVHLETRIFSVS